MNKKVLKVAFVAAIVMVSGVCFMNSQKSETLSEVALANVEALADGKPSGDFNCWWDSSYEKCIPEGTQLGCPCGSHNW